MDQTTSRMRFAVRCRARKKARHLPQLEMTEIVEEPLLWPRGENAQFGEIHTTKDFFPQQLGSPC